MPDYQPIQDESDGALESGTRLFAKQSDDSLEWVLPTSFEGEDGTDGVGVPAGGTTGQQLVKTDEVDYNTEWADPPDADEIDDSATTNKFATAAQLSAIATNTSDIGDLETALDAQSLPTGGTADQILVKTDGTNYNAEWSDFDADSIDDSTSTNKFATAAELAAIATNTSNLDDLSDDVASQVPPAGGDDGQVLTKASGTDYDYAWETPSGGGGGGGGDVDSVNGETGVVVLDADDIDDTGTNHRFTTAADISKLSGIESGAEANTVDSVNGSTGAVTLDPDDLNDAATTNKFATAAQLSKINSVETGAEVNDVDSVNGSTGAVVLDADDINDASTSHKFATAAQLSAVDGLGTAAESDTGDFATAAQGSLADSALQDVAVPGDIDATGTPSSSTFLRGDGAWASPAGGGGGDLLAANNLSDLDNAGTARTNLELGSAAQDDTGDFATAAQGTLADSATQPGDLATVATTGDYDDLTGKPTLGTAAAAATGDFATAAQGALADSATQPGDLGDLATQDTINNSDWSGADLAVTNGGTGASDASAARTALGVDTAISDAVDALKATLYCSVNHGATAGTARPTGYAGVIWYGSVAPTNATGVDLVIRTDEAVTP